MSLDAIEMPLVPSAATEKEARLADWLADWLAARPGVAIGYSGGVDSAYLAAVALGALGAQRVLAIIGVSASYPESQWAQPATWRSGSD